MGGTKQVFSINNFSKMTPFLVTTDENTKELLLALDISIL